MLYDAERWERPPKRRGYWGRFALAVCLAISVMYAWKTVVFALYKTVEAPKIADRTPLKMQ